MQLGPQGATPFDDHSPYMGSLFSRDPLLVSLARLADPDGEWRGILPARELASLVAGRPSGGEERVPYAYVHRGHRRALARAERGLRERVREGDPEAKELEARLEAFCRAASDWLEGDALYEVLRAEYGDRDYGAWQGPHAALDRALGGRPAAPGVFAARRDEIRRRHAEALRVYRFVQFVAAEQHARFHEESRRIGVRLYGDLQVGVSARDVWQNEGCFLSDYRLGAPPSRTNPDGQAWGYPVLDPDRYLDDDGGPGPALRFLFRRIERCFSAYDALRIDHPQGLVCPWVYRADDPDPQHAVVHGARLFSSPDLPDHAALARYAIVSADQLDTSPRTSRHADGRVVSLRPEQIDRYALLMDRVVEIARRHAPEEASLACEVLSTLPFPLACVLERHGLGRFRVTQKASPGDEADVYRPENARPHDWVMFGNHDTPSLWELLGSWPRDRIRARSIAAARALSRSPAERDALAASLARRPDRLAHAEIARLFASPAQNVMIFFADFFGIAASFNEPGTTGSGNWTLRLRTDWQERYAEQRRLGGAIDLRLALAMALRARSGHEELASRLERDAGSPVQAP